MRTVDAQSSHLLPSSKQHRHFVSFYLIVKSCFCFLLSWSIRTESSLFNGRVKKDVSEKVRVILYTSLSHTHTHICSGQEQRHVYVHDAPAHWRNDVNIKG